MSTCPQCEGTRIFCCSQQKQSWSPSVNGWHISQSVLSQAVPQQPRTLRALSHSLQLITSPILLQRKTRSLNSWPQWHPLTTTPESSSMLVWKTTLSQFRFYAVLRSLECPSCCCADSLLLPVVGQPCSSCMTQDLKW